MNFWHRPLIGMAGMAVVAVAMLSGCSMDSTASERTSSETPGASTGTTASTSPEPTESPTGAVEGFRAWLDRSRVPDAAAACAQLTPELATRMIAELNERGPIHVETCEEMITATAELYRALGQSADVDVSVREETATDATLFVTYLESGDCGTVVMTRAGTEWTITELSQECAT